MCSAPHSAEPCARPYPRGEPLPEPRSDLSSTDVDVVSTESPVVEEDMLTSEMLVEEVSIDGMCGVY
jgi:mycofactocin precursor